MCDRWRRHERRHGDLRRSERRRPVSPPEIRQSARPDRRRHRDRQDRDPADDRRRLCRIRRAGLHGRRQRRPVGHRPGRRRQSARDRAGQAAQDRGLRRPRLPDDLLGPVRREGPSGAHHGDGDRSRADGPPAAAQRHAGRRAQHRLQGRRRAGPAAARLQGPADRAAMDGRERGLAHHQIRQRQQAVDRHHPARPADLAATGRRTLLRRARARSQGHDRPSTPQAWAPSTSSPPTA